jgi:hypothetical protein
MVSGHPLVVFPGVVFGSARHALSKAFERPQGKSLLCYLKMAAALAVHAWPDYQATSGLVHKGSTLSGEPVFKRSTCELPC